MVQSPNNSVRQRQGESVRGRPVANVSAIKSGKCILDLLTPGRSEVSARRFFHPPLRKTA